MTAGVNAELVDEAAATAIALDFVAKHASHLLVLERVRLARGNGAWVALFGYAEERFMDPDHVLVEVDAVTGEARFFPMI